MISFDIERDLYNKKTIMIGVDEAGRGSWAGPLIATACWIDFRKYKKEINCYRYEFNKTNYIKKDT